MKNDRKLLIGLIAIAVVILAGVLIAGPSTQDQNQTAYEIPLKNQAFSFFDMAIPEGSNYTLKNNHTEVGKGMYYWQNTGNFSNETDTIIIAKNYTDKLIPTSMKLVLDNGTEKVYVNENTHGKYYKVVKTINDTDIIVSGYNLPLMEKMLNTTKVKDTTKMTLKEDAAKAPQNNTTSNNTKVENKTVEKNDTVKKTEDKKPIEVVIEQKKVETPAPKVEKTVSKEPLIIGGGSFTTGSDDADKTYAKIYVGIDHAGETVGTRIFYYRDNAALNHGNYVEATVDNAGYISIASADAYAYYPDFARVELYDSSGVLQDTQGIMLEKTSGTQYF